MESTMISLKVLSTAAAIALVLPLVAPGISAVQAQDRGGGARAGGGTAMGGGGAAIGGGGGRGGGSVAPSGDGGFRSGAVAGSGVVQPGVSGGRIAGSTYQGGTYQGGVYQGGGYRHHHRHRGGGFWPGFAVG